MESAVAVLEWVQRVAFTALALVSLALYVRHRSAPAAWAAAAFGSLAAIVLVAWIAGPDSDDLPLWFVKILIAVVLAFPYFLFRFAAAFVRPPRWAEAAGAALTGALILWTLALPSFPAEGEPQTGATRIYVLAIVVQWTVLSLWVSVRLWTAGRSQPTLPRRRLRLLSAAALGLNASVVVSGAAGGAETPTVDLVQQVLGIACAILFYLALDPPAALRALWRRPEEHSLRQASVGVSAATTSHEVSAALLPHIAPIFGGGGALLARAGGEVLGVYGMQPGEAARILARLGSDEGAVVEPGFMTLPLRTGWLAIKTSPYTPLFGNEEARLLEATGAFVDLALERTALFEAERLARVEVERGSAELEAFLHSVSHDLKSPLVALSGYVGYLEEDFGSVLGDAGREYLARMSANTSYMESLIHGLLELSRVRRVETDPEEVRLADLVGELAREIETAHDNVTVEVGALPILWMNGVRARQLFTNLLDNAVKHGDRPGLRISVSAGPADEGGCEIGVTDNGPGVPASDREKVFGVFERLEGPGGDGTGIGLSICRKIVEHLGGRIWIADGESGADFRIEVPAESVLGWPVEART